MRVAFEIFRSWSDAEQMWNFDLCDIVKNNRIFFLFQSILPTQERTAWFRYLYGNPIQLTVYNYPVNYGTMGTVLAAILAAFASRIFLQEMNKIL